MESASTTWRVIISSLEGANTTWRVIISTALQCGGLSSVSWRVIIGGMEGYYHDSGGCGVSLSVIISIVEDHL